MAPIASAELDALEYKLTKRGFRREDQYFHDCPDCHERAVRKYVTAGRTGGRDISLCEACGATASWRSGAGLEARELDPGFDLQAFLR
jgi:hypothetical protein